MLREKGEIERGQVTEFEFGLLAYFCKLYRHRQCCTDPSAGRRARTRLVVVSLNFRTVAAGNHVRRLGWKQVKRMVQKRLWGYSLQSDDDTFF